MPTIVDALHLYSQRQEKLNAKQSHGVIVSIADTVARVRIGGSQQTQEALISAETNAEVGDTVVLLPNMSNSRSRWVVTSVIKTQTTLDVISSGSNKTDTELFPPNNIRTIAAIPGVITLKWDSPISQAVVTEVQVSPDGTDDTAITELYSRGSYGIIVTDVPVYVRLCTISETGKKSGFSSWVIAYPQPSNLATETATHVMVLFSHDSVFPLLIHTLFPEETITNCKIFVTEPFNGQGSVTIGYNGYESNFITASDVNLKQAGIYELPFDFSLNDTTELYLYSGLTNCTEGAGKILIELTR